MVAISPVDVERLQRHYAQHPELPRRTTAGTGDAPSVFVAAALGNCVIPRQNQCPSLLLSSTSVTEWMCPAKVKNLGADFKVFLI
jgi:hypothetical protein